MSAQDKRNEFLFLAGALDTSLAGEARAGTLQRATYTLLDEAADVLRFGLPDLYVVTNRVEPGS